MDTTNKPRKRSVRLPVELDDRLSSTCDVEGVSISQAIRRAIDIYVEIHHPKGSLRMTFDFKK